MKLKKNKKKVYISFTANILHEKSINILKITKSYDNERIKKKLDFLNKKKINFKNETKYI
tara:strand:+ start:368 stop:547 length:180 start_codon:yes stop_codon:yes gene_type:complete